MEGYKKIAGIMAQHHDLAILRRFNTLNMKDLLYRQAELVHLESELHCIAEDDRYNLSRIWTSPKSTSIFGPEQSLL